MTTTMLKQQEHTGHFALMTDYDNGLTYLILIQFQFEERHVFWPHIVPSVEYKK